MRVTFILIGSLIGILNLFIGLHGLISPFNIFSGGFILGAVYTTLWR